MPFNHVRFWVKVRHRRKPPGDPDGRVSVLLFLLHGALTSLPLLRARVDDGYVGLGHGAHTEQPVVIVGIGASLGEIG